jgi:hypothetical protein
MDNEILQRLERMEAMMVMLVERQTVKDYYEVEEFARLVGKAPFTVREWCRLGRVNAVKRNSGRGAYATWVISHQEWLRVQKEGLLPLKRA